MRKPCRCAGPARRASRQVGRHTTSVASSPTKWTLPAASVRDLVDVDVLAAQQRLLGRHAEDVLADLPVRADHPVAGDQQRHRVVPERGADRAYRARAADLPRDPGVGPHLPARDGHRRVQHVRLERGQPAQVQPQPVRTARRQGQSPGQGAGRRRAAAGGRTGGGTRRRSRSRVSRCAGTRRRGRWWRRRRRRSGPPRGSTARRPGPAGPSGASTASAASSSVSGSWSTLLMGALPLVEAAEPREAPRDVGFDGALRAAEHVGDLGDRQVRDVPQHDREPLFLGSAASSAASSRPVSWRSAAASAPSRVSAGSGAPSSGAGGGRRAADRAWLRHRFARIVSSQPRT